MTKTIWIYLTVKSLIKKYSAFSKFLTINQKKIIDFLSTKVKQKCKNRYLIAYCHKELKVQTIPPDEQLLV